MVDSRFLKLLAMVLCGSIVSSALCIGFGEKISADTVMDFESDPPSSPCSFRSVEEAAFVAEPRITSQWSGHANLEITFTNNGDNTIHDWYFHV